MITTWARINSAREVLKLLPYYNEEGPDHALGYLSRKEIIDIAGHLIEQGKGDGVTLEMLENKKRSLKARYNS